SPVWPLAGHAILGQNVVVGSMLVLRVTLGNVPRGVWLDPRLSHKDTSPRLRGELPESLLLLSKAFSYRDFFLRPEKPGFPYSQIAHIQPPASFSVINCGMFSLYLDCLSRCIM